MSSAKDRVEPSLLVAIVQVAIHEELDPGFHGELVGVYCPEDFSLFAGVEAVDVDEGILRLAEARAEGVFVGESALEEFNIAEFKEMLCSNRKKLMVFIYSSSRLPLCDQRGVSGMDE